MAKRVSTHASRGGFSLIELMIAVAILGIITSQMFAAMSATKRSYSDESHDLDLQETARNVADLIAFDTRNAGMMVPREAAVSSVDGNDQGPDRLCLSSNDYFKVQSGLLWDRRLDRFTSVEVTGIAGDTVTLNTLDIDGDTGGGPTPVTDFKSTWDAGGGIILVQKNGLATYCDRIRNVTGNTVQMRGPVPPGTLNPASPPPNSMWAVPAVVYELVLQAGSTVPQLQRNGAVASTDIEDLQVEFWVDTASGSQPNGKIDPGEFPVHKLINLTAPTTPSATWTPIARIRNVRISVIARATVAEKEGRGQNRQMRPALANRKPATATDNFARRIYTVSVLPPNLLGSPDPALETVP